MSSAVERRRFVGQQLSNGRNVSGLWVVTEILDAWYVPKDRSIAVCYEDVEGRLQAQRTPARTTLCDVVS